MPAQNQVFVARNWDSHHDATKSFNLLGASMLEDPQCRSCTIAQGVPLCMVVCPQKLRKKANGIQSSTKIHRNGDWIKVRTLWIPSDPALMGSVFDGNETSGSIKSAQIEWEWKLEALVATSDQVATEITTTVEQQQQQQSFEGQLQWQIRLSDRGLRLPTMLTHGSNTIVAGAGMIDETYVAATAHTKSNSSEPPIVSCSGGPLLLSVPTEHLERDTVGGVQLVKASLMRKCEVLLDRPLQRGKLSEYVF